MDIIKFIFLIKKGVRKLTNATYDSEYPMWSPEGTWISYQANPKGKDNYDIFAIRPDGSETKIILATDACETDASWSPDGQHMVYVKDKIKPYILDLKTGESTLLLKKFGTHIFPIWLPDNNILLTTQNLHGWDVTNYDPKTAILHFYSREHNNCRGRISYQGDKITYTASGEKNASIWIMNLEGTNHQRITMDDNAHEYFVTWSPDGNYIAYCYSKREGPENWSLHIINWRTRQDWLIYDTQGKESYPAWFQ